MNIDDKFPNRFKIGIGGSFGPSYYLEISKESLCYRYFERRSEFSKFELITPSISDWGLFWQSLENINVWQWEFEYCNSDILDGTSWSIDIEWKYKTILSSGTNSYPDNFESFLMAVRQLIGNRDFQ